MKQSEQLPEIEKTHEQRVQEIYESAIAQHASFKELGEERLKGIIGTELERIDLLEEAGMENERNHFQVDKNTAEKIGAIWVFSGPGTYKQPFKEDRYKDLPWAAWMDRNRLQRAALLARHIAEIKSGFTPDRSKEFAGKNREALRSMIKQYAPHLIYNGTKVEDAVLQSVLDDDDPEHKRDPIFTGETVEIVGEGIDNTVDQIKKFELPDDLTLTGKEIVLLSHAPHLDRVLHFLQRYEPLPKGTVPRLFPIAMPRVGGEEYTLQEIRGLLYYMFISKNKDAAEEVPPYTVNTG
jgi:hypothetical protein